MITTCLFLVACSKPASNNRMHQNQDVIALHFGEQGIQDFAKNSNTPVDRQPAGMNFLSLDWTPPQLGRVRVITEKSNLEIENVISVLGTQIARRSNDGIQIMDIDASLHSNEYTTSQEAYAAYTKLVHQINDKQWKQYFLPFSARIDKKDNLKHMTETMGEVIDPTYILSFKEWQDVFSKTNRLVFNLYNGEVELGISLRRTYKDDKKEQYMVRYSFENFKYAGRNTISDSDKMNSEQLKQAFETEVANNKKVRQTEENNMKKEGYHIDESYIDPDIWPYVK
ncbi:hypothetical protein [Acinetobacter baumannii]|uniref:hypothetical protein n=1 Tax=Acinetobacter baumannii TaxID=470 RepID=UPI0005C76112|nr:hypothetical protein [Acinetobacter baumannii]